MTNAMCCDLDKSDISFRLCRPQKLFTTNIGIQWEKRKSFVLFCLVLFYAIATVFQLYQGSDMRYEMRSRNPDPTLLPIQGMFYPSPPLRHTPCRGTGFWRRWKLYTRGKWQRERVCVWWIHLYMYAWKCVIRIWRKWAHEKCGLVQKDEKHTYTHTHTALCQY